MKNPDLNIGTDVVFNLRRLHLYSPNFILISHWHLDHFYAYIDLKKHGASAIWLVPKIDAGVVTSACRLIKYIIKNRNSHVKSSKVYCLDGSDLIYDSKSGFQIWKGNGGNSDKNSNGLILRINDTLFAGDCLYRYWPTNLVNQLGSIKKIVVPHHGSNLGVGKSLIENTAQIAMFTHSDKNAYISYGCNTYGHPDGNHMHELDKAHFVTNETPKCVKSGGGSYFEFEIE